MANDSQRSCIRTAEGQHGVLGYSQALDQALGCGISRYAIPRRVSAGDWEVVLPRVYRLGGAPATWLPSLMAACLRAGPEAAVSYRAVAALHGLPGFKRSVVEVSTAGNRKLGSDWLVCHRVSALPPPVREHEVRGEDFRGRVDFAWPNARVAVEADGFAWHGGSHEWQRDRTKRNLLTRHGWTVLQVDMGRLDRARSPAEMRRPPR